MTRKRHAKYLSSQRIRIPYNWRLNKNKNSSFEFECILSFSTYVVYTYGCLKHQWHRIFVVNNSREIVWRLIATCVNLNWIEIHIALLRLARTIISRRIAKNSLCPLEELNNVSCTSIRQSTNWNESITIIFASSTRKSIAFRLINYAT